MPAESTVVMLPQQTLESQMIRRYEIRSGRRTVSTQESVSPLQAVVDYMILETSQGL